MLEILWDAVLDSVRLLPFLFLTYLAMELLEHRAGEKAKLLIRKAGRLGPVFGSVLGIVPQCGFAAAASGLYAGRVITMGTLLAVFLSTSDEMLPILLSEGAAPGLILQILGCKIVIAVAAGFLTDLLLWKRQPREASVEALCEQESCGCEKGILRSAVSHTLQITFFIFLVTLGLNLLLMAAGEDALAGFLLDRPVLGPFFAALVGLIPNCAASVVITQLYVKGAISFGSMIAGLLTGAGVGVLVLCRVNHHKKENLLIIGLLLAVGTLAGILLG